jgi:tungstate transport system ATP-binding protein
MIKIRDLLIQRNGHDVLYIDSLDIAQGETLTVVGPNGAGKSTLLLALARLIEPAHGEINFAGKSLNDWNELEYRRKISFVFQSPLLMDMTVEQNVALGLKSAECPGETQARVGQWIRRLGINPVEAARQVSYLGERRRGRPARLCAGARVNIAG